MLIRELPIEERPRERLVLYGPGVLSNTELLAILIGSGTKEASALSLAQEILAKEGKGLSYLTDCSLEELSQIKGIGLSKATKLLAAIELGKRLATRPREKKVVLRSSKAIADLFMEEMRYYRKEFFKVLLLNVKAEVISTHQVSIGDICTTVVHPREVFVDAVRRSAAAIVLVHNHPSGDPTPSSDDLHTTDRLVEAGKILGIQVVDHIVIGDGVYISFREQNLMKE